jgi:hypothetical protein
MKGTDIFTGVLLAAASLLLGTGLLILIVGTVMAVLYEFRIWRNKP